MIIQERLASKDFGQFGFHDVIKSKEHERGIDLLRNTPLQSKLQFTATEVAGHVVLGNNGQYLPAGVYALSHVVQERLAQFKVAVVDAKLDAMLLKNGDQFLFDPLHVFTAECYERVVFVLLGRF